MELYNEIVSKASDFVWGPPMMILLVGTGLFLTFFLFFIQFRGFIHAFKVIMGKYDDPNDPGEINHFQALMAALSATIGTGNIVGVAAAILIGGPGAVFWMWVTATVGMATKFASCTLAVKYRRIDEEGEAHGGPMHFIEQGMGPKFKWLAILFAVFTAIASFGIGNMFQINNVMTNVHSLMYPEFAADGEIGLPFKLIVGIIFAGLTGAVIVGGIKSIGRAASFIVPVMCALYIVSGLIIIFMNLAEVVEAFKAIFYYAFNSNDAVAGGLLGATIRYGVARGLFSNEAGLGSAPMAHGAARTDEPVREGLVAMIGPFIDTIIVCSITGLVIVLTGAYEIPDVKDGQLTSIAFEQGLGSAWGGKIVSIGIVFFAFSTMITWSYYGNRAADYLFGKKAVLPYQVVYLAFIVWGSCQQLDDVLTFSDVMNGAMAIPNLIALLVLSPVVLKLTRDYFRRMKEEGA